MLRRAAARAGSLTADELVAALDFAALAPARAPVRRGEHGRDGRRARERRRAHRADLEPRRPPALPRAAHARGCRHGRGRHVARRALRPARARPAPARAARRGRPGRPTRSRSSSAAGSTCPADLPLLRRPGVARRRSSRRRDASLEGCAAQVDYLRSRRSTSPRRSRTLRAEHGVRSILCEGGPSLNASLLAAGLIDELFLTTRAGKLAGGAGALTIIGDAPLDEPRRRAPAVAARARRRAVRALRRRG